jgi:hypothetical protein
MADDVPFLASGKRPTGLKISLVSFDVPQGTTVHHHQSPWTHFIFRFPNGRGVSVIDLYTIAATNSTPWETTVFNGEEPDYEFDVMHNQSADDVSVLLLRISQMPETYMATQNTI